MLQSAVRLLKEARRRSRRLLRQGARYRQAYSWLVGYVGKRCRWQVTGILVGASAGLALITLGVGMLVGLATSLETGTSIFRGSIRLPASDTVLLPRVAGAASAFIISGALLVFLARGTAVSVAALIQGLLTRDIVAAQGGLLPQSADYTDDRAVQGAVLRLLRNDTYQVSLALRRGLEAPVSIGIVLVTASVLLYLEPRALLLALGLLALAFPLLYVFNLQAVRATRDYESSSPRARDSARAIVDSYSHLPSAVPFDTQLTSSPNAPISLASEAFRRRFMAAVRSDLINQLATALVLLGLVWYLGVAALSGNLPFTIAATFVVVLRFMLNAVRTLVNIIAVLSRYYPGLQRIQSFVRTLGHIPTVKPDAGLVLSIPRGTITDLCTSTIRVTPPTTIGVWTPFRPTRFTTGFFQRLLHQLSADRSTGIFIPVNVIPTPSRTKVAVPIETRALMRYQRSSQQTPAEPCLPSEARPKTHALVSPERWHRLPLRSRVSLVADVASRDPPGAVVTTATVMSKLGTRPTEWPFVFVVDPNKPVGGEGLHVVVAADGHIEFLGTAEHLCNVWDEVQGRVTVRHKQLRSAGYLADMEDA